MTIGQRNRWSIADAKARLSAVVAQAERQPQVLERRGEPVAVVLSIEDFQKVGDPERGTLHGARLAEFLELSARIRSRGGGHIKLPRRVPRASPFRERR